MKKAQEKADVKKTIGNDLSKMFSGIKKNK